MWLDPGPLGLLSAIAAIIWKPVIAAIAEPFLSAIAAIVIICDYMETSLKDQVRM